MLGFIGPKVMSRKQKRNLAQNGPRIVGADSKGFWPNWADRVQRYPWLSAGVALIIIVVIALPFFSLRLGSADQGTDPAGTPTRVAFDTLSKGFGPGFNGPLMLVSVVQPDQHDVVNTVVHDVSQQADVAKVAQPLFIPSKTGSGDVMLLNVYPKTAPQDAATTDLVNHLRSDTLPQAIGGFGGQGARRRHDGHLHRLRQRPVVQAAPLHRPRGPAVVPALDDGVPQLRHPVDRGGR